jgi:acyl dehydratase
MPRTVAVSRPPSNAAILARGLTRRRAGGALPDVVLVRDGVRVHLARLAAYQELVGEAVSDAVPAGYLHTLVFGLHMAMLARPDFPLPPLGMVHVANRIEQRRAVDAGEVLDARVHAENLAPHRRGATVDLVGELAVAGEVVWRGTSTYLAKGVHLPDAGPAPDVERPAFEPPAPTGLWRLPADTGRRYAAVSGDRNPIHTSRLAARAFGFARPIAHGMDTAARALAHVGPARGDAYAWDVEFGAPVLLPATVSVRVAPEEPAGEGFALTVWSRKPHLTGTVRPLGAPGRGD